MHEYTKSDMSSDEQPLDEYTALQKYISTYRDPKAAQQEEAAEKAGEKKTGKKAWQVRRRRRLSAPHASRC